MSGLACNHLPGDGSTLIIADDGCSLECEVCHEIVVEVERISMVVSGNDIEWVG